MPADSNNQSANELSNRDRVKSDELSARLYVKRKPRKHNSEMQLVEQAFQLLPANEIQTVLDAPCGVGRVSVWLAQQGFQVTGVDLGEAAVELTRETLAQNNLAATIEAQNIMSMTYHDEQFDGSICLRLLHHFEHQEDKINLINELCRVTKKYVVISYFSTRSVTSIKRRIRHLVSGKPVKQYPDRLEDLEKKFAANGFVLHGRVKRSAILHSLQMAVFRRD